MAKVFTIRKFNGVVKDYTEGEKYKAIGTSGMAKDLKVVGTLKKGNFNEYVLVNHRGIPCSINEHTLEEVE